MTTEYTPFSRRTRGRKLGTIKKTADELAYQRVIYLPLDLAVLYSAVQNFRLDLAKGYHPDMTSWHQVEAAYFYEVQELFEENGCNHFPGDNAEPWIHVRSLSATPHPTGRIMKLKEIFDEIFSRNDESLLSGELYPTPLNCITPLHIDRLHLRMQQKMQMH